MLLLHSLFFEEKEKQYKMHYLTLLCLYLSCIGFSSAQSSWQALVLGEDSKLNLKYLCGGVLVSSDSVLTSGQCIDYDADDAKFSNWTIVLGTDTPLQLGVPGKKIVKSSASSLNEPIENVRNVGLIKIKPVTGLAPVSLGDDLINYPQIQACGYGLLALPKDKPIPRETAYGCSTFVQVDKSFCDESISAVVCYKPLDDAKPLQLDIGSPAFAGDGTSSAILGLLDSTVKICDVYYYRFLKISAVKGFISDGIKN